MPNRSARVENLFKAVRLTKAFCIHPDDNVATLLNDAPEQAIVQVLGSGRCREVTGKNSIQLGHKIALCDIADGEPIIKFGVTIGRATKKILAGQWVHLHNCTSLFDERSQTLELHTGASTDTRYE